jgi:hypothetical protein
MRGTNIVLAILAIMLSIGAVDAGPYYYLVAEHTMASDIGKYSEPLGRTSEFSTADDQAVSWLLAWRDNEVHSVEWRWYYPEGRTYARSFGVIPALDWPAGKWAAPIWSCLKIRGYDAARLPGMWKVDVFVDYKKVLTDYFTIDGPATCH